MSAHVKGTVQNTSNRVYFTENIVCICKNTINIDVLNVCHKFTEQRRVCVCVCVCIQADIF